MSRKRKHRGATALYCRSYLVTLGIVFTALGVFVWQRDGADASTWPWWGFAVLAAFLLGGIALVLLGLLGPNSKMESWAETTSRHEASIFIMVLAVPVYLLLAPFYKQR